MQHQNSEAFHGAIRYQNHLLAKQYVVMINNLGTEVKYCLSDQIKVIQGLHNVVPTKKISQNGKFYVLVDKSSKKKVRESLKKSFNAWYRNRMPEDAMPKDGRFGAPWESETLEMMAIQVAKILVLQHQQRVFVL